MRQRYARSDSRRASAVAVTVHGEDLEQVSVLKYLGRPLSSNDSDWPGVSMYWYNQPAEGANALDAGISGLDSGGS